MQERAPIVSPGREVVARISVHLSVVQRFCVGRRRHDIIPRLHVQKKSSDLTDLLADNKIAGVVGVEFLVERIQLIFRSDSRQVCLPKPANRRVAAIDEVAGV